MGNFTQGPWYVDDSMIEHGCCWDKAVVAKVEMGKGNYGKDILLVAECAEDNFNIIAAAPDLYNALWEAVELSDRTLPPSGRTAECQRVYDLCRAALAKAEGE